MSVELSIPAVQIGLVTNDYPAMARFYGEVLGFSEDPPVTLPGLTTYKYRCGDSVIKIVSLDVQIEQAPPVDAAETIFRSTGYRYMTIPVRNLDEILTACVAAGVRVITPKTEIQPGVYVCLLQDPDGNCVELKEENMN